MSLYSLPCDVIGLILSFLIIPKDFYTFFRVSRWCLEHKIYTLVQQKHYINIIRNLKERLLETKKQKESPIRQFCYFPPRIAFYMVDFTAINNYYLSYIPEHDYICKYIKNYSAWIFNKKINRVLKGQFALLWWIEFKKDYSVITIGVQYCQLLKFINVKKGVRYSLTGDECILFPDGFLRYNDIKISSPDGNPEYDACYVRRSDYNQLDYFTTHGAISCYGHNLIFKHGFVFPTLTEENLPSVEPRPIDNYDTRLTTMYHTIGMQIV